MCLVRMRWLRFWTHRQQSRRRRAYFRPADASDLDAALVPLIDHIVTVRFTDVADADNRFAGQRLYCIVEPETSAPTFVRPERDFDFLE
jgi:hypothetical protein